MINYIENPPMPRILSLRHDASQEEKMTNEITGFSAIIKFDA
jgi:hypothetical protein